MATKKPTAAKTLHVDVSPWPIQTLLRTARESLGMTQKDVAKKMHRTQAAVSKLEHRPEDEWLVSDIASYAHAVGLQCSVKFVPKGNPQ